MNTLQLEQFRVTESEIPECVQAKGMLLACFQLEEQAARVHY
jgi:hypothetical protein